MLDYTISSRIESRQTGVNSKTSKTEVQTRGEGVDREKSSRE